jgi:tRNA nucleotidyltransferase (CCA-adding enzyme)
MQVFAVGGAVRDELLGLPVKDRDFVVVGATPAEMLARGFRAVGRDFPVFLHPETHEEYALARTERKSGRGHHGFTFHAAPDVTLEQDLARRDLTINAIARAADGTLIDPFGGIADLERRVLRHVGPAFAEDPLRVLRVARFAARFADFTLAPETAALMAQMVEQGEVDELVAERVWQELGRGLMSDRPARMLEILRACGALARILPELCALVGVAQRPEYHPEGDAWVHTMQVLEVAACRQTPLPVRFAALLHDVGKGATPPALLPRHHGHEERGARMAAAIAERLKVPADCRELAILAAREHGRLHQLDRSGGLTAATVVRVLEACDAFRRPARFADLLAVAACDHAGRGSPASDDAGRRLAGGDYPAGERWQRALAAASAVDAGAIAAACDAPAAIGERVRQARIAAVSRALAAADESRR